MEYRRLGRSGVKVSVIGLGSWLTYGMTVDRERSQACVRRAYELGVNFFDTADVYYRGAAETELGLALDGIERSSYVLATKVFGHMSDATNDGGLSRKHIIESCDKSLRRLKTDYIDLYQCHRYDDDTPLDETLRALDDLITSGKVHYAGVSEWAPAEIQAAADFAEQHNIDQIVSNQPQYSILWRRIEKDIIPLCERLGIGQVVWSPLAQGVLTGKYRKGATPPADSRGGNEQLSGMIRGFLTDEVLDGVERLRPIAERLEISMAQLALAWVLRQPNVSSAIIGASRPEQVDDNAAASGIKLDEATLDEIDVALGAVLQS